MLWSTFKDAFLTRLSLHGGGEHLAKAREILGRFTRYVDPLHVADIDQATYERYLARRKQDTSRKTRQPISIATLNGEIRYLNMTFAYALEYGIERLDLPAGWRPPRVKRLREPKRRVKTLPEELLARVFDSCRFATKPALKGCTAEHWWRTFFLIAYITGIRARGLLSLLRPSDAELARQELVIAAEFDKSDSDRVFHLTPAAVAAIRKLPAAPGERLFDWPHGRRYFYRVLEEFQLKAGLTKAEKGLPHDLRRTKATTMIRQGASLPLVQRELGHSTPEITAKFYVGELTSEQRLAVERLPVPEFVLPGSDKQLLLF